MMSIYLAGFTRMRMKQTKTGSVGDYYLISFNVLNYKWNLILTQPVLFVHKCFFNYSIKLLTNKEGETCSSNCLCTY